MNKFNLLKVAFASVAPSEDKCLQLKIASGSRLIRQFKFNIRFIDFPAESNLLAQDIRP